ncbi:MAG TPA: PilN domain-containing protein [Terriglobia bacterium]|nr:PilN domain-containing protein [Terriglobia bacterium]
MIKINLLGRTKLRAAKTKKISTASNQTLMAVMAVAVVLMSVGIIYFWERILVQQDEELSRQITLAKKEKLRQEGMLRENEVFEKRRKLLETRINVIESLKKNQSGPVQVLDLLSDCIQRSEGVWLKDLAQKGNLITVNGTAMGSPDAVADLITNLTRVGNFKNVNLVNLQELDSKYSFSITFEGNIVADSAS